MFADGVTRPQGFIIAEKNVLFEITDFTIAEGLTSLLASYYVYYISYPKSSPGTGILLFMQELLLCIPDNSTKKTSKYSSLIDCLTTI